MENFNCIEILNLSDIYEKKDDSSNYIIARNFFIYCWSYRKSVFAY